MKMKLASILCVLVFLGVIATPSILSAQDDDTLYVTGVWARPTALDSAEANPDAVSAAYMTIENAGETTVRLVAAETPAAGLVEIHETTIGEGDVMRMRPVEDGIVIPPGERAELRPGGYHIMLLELERDLLPWDAFSMTMRFETLDEAGEAVGDSFDLTIGVPVLEEAPEPTDFVVLDAWARHTISEGDVSAVYLRLLNRGSSDDQLIGAGAPAAGLVEIHETAIGEGDVMRMRPIKALPVAAGEIAALQPRGNHIMLINLERVLEVDDALLVTLMFESDALVVIGVPVRDPLAEATPEAAE